MLNTYLFNEVVPNATVPPSYHHYCIDGSYRRLAKNVNHAFVISKDNDGNYFFGEAMDNELEQVGQRLDFKYLQALDTQAEAEATAQAILIEERLNSARGFIIAHPCCGIELWDVIRIYDSMADQHGEDFRVSGVVTVWSPAAQTYYQKIFLCGL